MWFNQLDLYIGVEDFGELMIFLWKLVESFIGSTVSDVIWKNFAVWNDRKCLRKQTVQQWIGSKLRW